MKQLVSELRMRQLQSRGLGLFLMNTLVIGSALDGVHKTFWLLASGSSIPCTPGIMKICSTFHPSGSNSL